MTSPINPGSVFHDRGQLVALQFMQDNVAASQSNVQLPIAQVASAAENVVDGYAMPWAGTIVGVSMVISTVASAGSMTVGATIDGTEAADPTLAVTIAAAQADTATRGTASFAAGAVIGAEITTDGTWNATSSDLGVTVWVLLDVTGV